MSEDNTTPQAEAVRAALIDLSEFGWSAVTCDCEEAREELQRRINNGRKALSTHQGEAGGAPGRDVLARKLYEFDPVCESESNFGGVLLSPGGNLSWEEAEADYPDAISECSRRADAILALFPTPAVAEEDQDRRGEVLGPVAPKPALPPTDGDGVVAPSTAQIEASARAIYDEFHALGWSDDHWPWGDPLSDADGFRRLALAALKSTASSGTPTHPTDGEGEEKQREAKPTEYNSSPDSEQMIAELCEALERARRVMDSATIFLTSREQIRKPEGHEWWSEEISAVGTAIAKAQQHKGADNGQ